jgi:apoptosis-inducing factor 2
VAVGSTPRGEIIKTLSPALYNPATHSIRVKGTLQVDDNAYPNIFAAGDIADTPDLKMAYKTGLHAPIIAKNIHSLIKGQTPSAIYQPTTGSEMMTLPMGKMGGVSYLAFFGGTSSLTGTILTFRVYVG